MDFIFENIPVRFEHRRVKNINIYVKQPDGHILITAPQRTTKKEVMSVLSKRREWITRSSQRVARKARLDTRAGEIAAGEEELAALLTAVKEYVDKWEPVMGVHAAHWTIRQMKTRWGSCSVNTGRIRLNAKLAAYPRECLEYVVVHELCHLLEPSHNQMFQDYMTRFMPDWKDRKRRLGGE